mmetsp:Transcript_25071/g.58446  ORF Transcript_25071/g.58446 Transcript_25071/m.58446 type:complete len:242 (-) Transcript_25071:167-892(-)
MRRLRRRRRRPWRCTVGGLRRDGGCHLGGGHESERHLDARVGEVEECAVLREHLAQLREWRGCADMLAAGQPVLVREGGLVVECVRLANLCAREGAVRPCAVSLRIALADHVKRLLALEHDVPKVLSKRERLRNTIRERVEIIVAADGRAAAPRQRVGQPDGRPIEQRLEADALERRDELHGREQARLEPLHVRREEVPRPRRRRAAHHLTVHGAVGQRLIRSEQQAVALLPDVCRAGEVS